jgi:methyl-accepting chemotaxis protein
VTVKWGDEGFAEVCDTIRNLVSGLQSALPEVKKLIKDGKISLQDFEHTKFNSCEIIP